MPDSNSNSSTLKFRSWVVGWVDVVQVESWSNLITDFDLVLIRAKIELSFRLEPSVTIKTLQNFLPSSAPTPAKLG